MNPTELDFHYQTIKGRIAEAIIEELFLINGYDVFRFGMENSIPGIIKSIKGCDGKATDRIRKMPDLLVKKGDKTFLIEVKYRADGQFLRNRDCPSDFPYKECYFIIVSKNEIRCISFSELTHKGKEIFSDSEDFSLLNRKEFQLHKESIEEFKRISEMIYGGVQGKINGNR